MSERRVIIQTKEEYYTGQYQKLRFLWWVIASILFTSVFYFIIKGIDKLFYIFAFFMALFVIADLTKNGKTKAYIRTVIGFFYLAWSIICIILFILMRKENDIFLLLIFAGVFLYLSYKDFKENTNFIELILSKFKK